ncbi:AlpA family phage regulatory protein [Entomomonas sp. E2T0]|uniref:helix-turn-helix transcriptional regulator n=1 Tax=Entomomonas sp. E2T0 TaxID=2930213 RepID=UPI0022283941|nr:AlpA family phage regulatory protein [Entomomonas sp. E2T0]UYZ83685.1 AlpA family phage regulatory protein [Entomomonas sp. E2T0]
MLSTKKFIKLSQVISITGLSRATIYNYVNAGIFPQYTKVGRSTFWEYNEIQEWIEQRLAERQHSKAS